MSRIAFFWVCLFSAALGRRVVTNFPRIQGDPYEERQHSHQERVPSFNSLAELKHSEFSHPPGGILVTGPGRVLAEVNGSGQNDSAKDLRLESAAVVIPHPKKANRQYELAPHCGGEDAYFTDDAAGVLGVADGVGGWAKQGVDPGFFSRQLMSFASEAVQKGAVEPLDILQYAHFRTTHLGSSTAVILSFFPHSTTMQAPSKIKVANLGDSGFLLLRRGTALFQSLPQQHGFNYPFQLASPRARRGDRPTDAQIITIEHIEEGDVIILGSDGLFDNAFATDIERIVRHAEETRSTGSFAKIVAEEIAKQTSEWARDQYRKSPFAQEAEMAGHRYQGGKLDDITVVVAEVTRSVSADELSK